jgi:hypothetical protein
MARACRLCALALAAACTRRVAPLPLIPPPPPPPASVEHRQVAIDNGFVTVDLDIPNEPPGRKPVIISPVGDPQPLLAAGVILVSYRVNWQLLRGLATPPQPAPPPGKMVGAWLLASPSAATVGQAYFGLIAFDAHDAIPHIVDYLVTLPEVAPARIGIAGASTSGFVALEAVAEEPRLAAAAVLVACGDYHGFLARSVLALGGRTPLRLDPKYEAWLCTREPIRYPARLTHAAILMVNGDRDTAVPARCAITTARVLRKAYRRAGVPDRFRFVLVRGAGHNLPDRGAREAMQWWHRWLLRTPDGGER